MEERFTEEKEQNIEAVLTQRSEDGFYKTEILDLLGCLEGTEKNRNWMWYIWNLKVEVYLDLSNMRYPMKN